MQLVPAAKVGHIGLYRDPETASAGGILLQAAPMTLPSVKSIVHDPMLATGGSAHRCHHPASRPGAVKNIKFMCIIAAPEGLRALQDSSPRCEDVLLRPWTTIWTSTSTSFPAWAMPATVSSAPSNPCRESEKRRKLPPLFSFMTWLPFPAVWCESVSAPTVPRQWAVRFPGRRAIKQRPRRALAEKPPQLSCFRLGGAEAPVPPLRPSDGLYGFRDGEP